VLEKFTPHDTVFSFTDAKDLTESALSSACSLHTSVGSQNSSTSSLHRRKLGEITEDVEEGSGERRKSALRHSILSDEDSDSKEGRNTVAVQGPASSNLSPDSHLPKNNNSPSTPASLISTVRPIPKFDKSLPATPEPDTPAPRKTSDVKAADGGAEASIEDLIPPRLEDQRPSLDSRRSSQSTRPLVLEPDSAISYKPFKPKVKLGPRPTVQRPHTPGSRGEARPVANLPTSVRVSARPSSSASRPPSSASHRPTSQQSNRSAHSTFVSRYDRTPLPPLPQPSIHISALYQPSNIYLLNRPASPTLSATPSITPSRNPGGPPGITPEKQRLMKALQLRKQQQLSRSSQARASNSPTAHPQTLKMAEVRSTTGDVKPSTIKEGSDEHHDSQPIQLDKQDGPVAASSQDAVPPVTTHNAANHTHTVAKDIEVSEVDSPLDSKDVDLESAMPDATVPTLKSGLNVQSKSPVLPPITPQNRLSMGILSPLKQQTEEICKADSEVNPSPTAEEIEQPSAAIQPSNAQSNPIPLVKAIEEQSPQPKPPPVVNDEKSTHLEAEPKLYVEHKFSIEPRLAVSENVERHPTISERRTRRRQVIEQRESVANSETSDSSEDEAFYDELQTATLEQAKPVIVARSPRFAVFNRGSPDPQQERNSFISIQTCKTDASLQSTPERAKLDGGRSLSYTLPVWPPKGEPAQSLLVKNTNVSTGISQRIKALEIFSGGSSPNSAPLPSPPLTSGLVKRRLPSQSASESLVRNASTRTPPAKQVQYPSPAPTPTTVSAAADNQLSRLQSTGINAGGLAPRRKGDSISVTARIIRDPAEMKSNEASNSSGQVPMNLHRSPLVVEHEKGEAAPQHEALKVGEPSVVPVASTEQEARSSEASKPEGSRLSLSSSQSNSGHMTSSESFTKRLSMTIRHGRSESGNLPRSASDSSSVGDEKFSRESRKTRLMKRVSVLKAGSRRSLASAFGSNVLRHDEAATEVGQPPDSIAERSGEVTPEGSSIAESHSHVVDIGDVNIQFPDTLLWKRRFMRIDDQGFIILTPPTMEANKRGVSRRFHLSDIKKPSLPAPEREELPWSIVLDFEDGSCLQVACESRYAQGQVLRSRLPKVSILFDSADRRHSARRRTCCVSVVVSAILIPLELTGLAPSANVNQ
jgi:hypothetical protein